MFKWCRKAFLYVYTNPFCIVKDKNNKIRRITVTEAERLQTLPEGYTKGISDSKRYAVIGNGWTVDVISHIFQFLKEAEGGNNS